MNVYDHLLEVLQAHEEKPYAILMGKRPWRDLTRDSRAGQHILNFPGDPDTFMGVPVRIEGLKTPPKAFETAQDMHDELYPPKER